MMMKFTTIHVQYCRFVNQKLAAIVFPASAQSPNISFGFCATGICRAITVAMLNASCFLIKGEATKHDTTFKVKK